MAMMESRVQRDVDEALARVDEQVQIAEREDEKRKKQPGPISCYRCGQDLSDTGPCMHHEDVFILPIPTMEHVGGPEISNHPCFWSGCPRQTCQRCLVIFGVERTTPTRAFTLYKYAKTPL